MVVGMGSLRRKAYDLHWKLVVPLEAYQHALLQCTKAGSNSDWPKSAHPNRLQSNIVMIHMSSHQLCLLILGSDANDSHHKLCLEYVCFECHC